MKNSYPLQCDCFYHLTSEPLLFIHGNLASSAWWGPVVNEWQKAGPLGPYPLLLADLRGCGRNPEVERGEKLPLEDLAADLLRLLETKGFSQESSTRVALAGHSLGGLIALQMMIMAPKAFSRALLLDPVGATGIVFDESMYAAFDQMAADRELTGSIILSTLQNPDGLAPDLKNKIVNDAFKAVGGMGTSILRTLKNLDLRPALKKVTLPTLILHGEQDVLIPKADSEELSRLLPNAKLELVKGAGHCLNVDDPVTFTKRARKWFTS